VLRVRPLAVAGLALASLAVAAGIGAGVGCSNSTTTATYTPFTGITIHVSDLLGSLTCGTSPGQVYKYTAVAWYEAPDGGDGGPVGAPAFSGVWDCFTDAILENLPVADNGSDTFFLRVYAYSYAGVLAASSGTGSGEAGPGDGSAGDGGLPSAIWCPGGLGPNGEPCPLQDASFAESLGADAQWTTTCAATETEGAPVTAICTPLSPVSPIGTSTPDADDPGPPDATAEATTD
jgi:hypothetical protein